MNSSKAIISRISLADLTCAMSNTRGLLSSDEEIEIVREGWAKVGSVVVCQVVAVGAHEKVESWTGRYIRLQAGCLIMGVIGNRYSTISMYGGVPAEGIQLPREEPVDLLSAGGLIGECISYPSYRGSPTKLLILGLASSKGELLEIHPHIMARHLDISCPLILIAGTSANVGKTKFAAKLTYYLSRTRKKQVAATKLAGAGNYDDILNLHEAGAKDFLDFVDAGLVSTYGYEGETVVSVAKGILNRLVGKQPEVIIAELGGDLVGANVPAILADRQIRKATSAIILVPSDIMAAEGALHHLKDFGSKVYISQPIKNPATSQVRAYDIIGRRLYNCEEMKDLEDLVEDILPQSNISYRSLRTEKSAHSLSSF